jgi:hypothetical protein
MKTHSVEQRSPEWRALRAGLPTASAFSNLVTPTGKLSTQIHDYAVTLANELYLDDSEPDGFMGNAWTDRGEELEEQAVSWYEFVTGADVTPVGFVTEKGKGWEAGCSPDGLVGKDGVLEIKALKAVHHTAALREYKTSGATQKKYNAQTQGQIMITGRKWADLLFFHDRLPPFFIHLEPDKELAGTIKAQLAAVCTERDDVLKALKSAGG